VRPNPMLGLGGPSAIAELLELFIERVEDCHATVRRVTEAEVPAALQAELAARRVIVPAGFPYDVPGAVALSDRGLLPSAFGDVDAVVTTAAVAIAKTGTIILDHGPGQGRRAMCMIPDLHVCVVRADQVVPGLSDAVGRLDSSRPQTWISGPSATRDIELTRVEGEHGPRTLCVILVL
jgi:L-lactate dehydrogenase complex protein LldG